MKRELLLDYSEGLSKEENKELQDLAEFLTEDKTDKKLFYSFLRNKQIPGKNLQQCLVNKSLELKKKYKNSFAKNPFLVFILYKIIPFLSLEDLKKIFPAEKAVVEQNIFDYSTQIFKAKTNDDAVENFAKSFVSEAFKKNVIQKNKPSNYEEDQKLLQKIFFFFLWDLASLQSSYNEKLFTNALKTQWYSNECLSNIMNQLAVKSCFNLKGKLKLPDFTGLKGIHFEQNESILRLLYNFTRPDSAIKEGILNELNFLREQQIAIIPIWPNTNKKNYSQSEADKEIQKVKANLKILKQIDFGFSDSEFKQAFFIHSQEKKKILKRPLKCKFIKETELEWKSLERKGSSIIAYNDDRIYLKRALSEKYLYLERNALTHLGKNFALYILFEKDFGKEKYLSYELLLNTLFYAKNYLKHFNNSEIAEELIEIVNYFFNKTVSKLEQLKNASKKASWKLVFDKEGKLRIPSEDLPKTNIFNIFSDTELEYFKRFLNFLYCSENLTEDFILRNKTRIMLYLIYLSLEISKLDK